MASSVQFRYDIFQAHLNDYVTDPIYPLDPYLKIKTGESWAGDLCPKQPIYETILKNSDKPSNQILESIVDEIERFQEGYSLADDVTLVVIKTWNLCIPPYPWYWNRPI